MRSIELFKQATESREKFDYFVCSVAGALFAYVGQNYIPAKLDFSPVLFEPLALLLLVISFFAGLKRIEGGGTIKKLNMHCLDLGEKAGEMTKIVSSAQPGFNTESGQWIEPTTAQELRRIYIEKVKDLEDEIESHGKKGLFAYEVRNACLAGGFLALLAAKILKPYV